MDKSRLEIKVGLFVIIGLVLLAALLIMFSKGASLFHGTYELRLHASNVGGLKQRAGVLLAGVQVGTVSTIQLADDGKSVTILLKIYNRNKIYHDARFVIEMSGFLGDQYVSIIPTSNAPPALVNGDEVNCQEPFNLQEVARSTSGFIKRIDETAKKLDDSVTDLRRVVLNEQTLTNFSVTFSNMRTFSEQALGTVGDINALVATNGADITAAVKNIESSAKMLKSLMNDVQSGKGFAGTMLQNEQLATNVQFIANNLAVASSNLNRLGLWRFLWHKEPVRTPPGGTTATNTPAKP
jgi:ABC-type transporter Mla subunit MlaD